MKHHATIGSCALILAGALAACSPQADSTHKADVGPITPTQSAGQEARDGKKAPPSTHAPAQVIGLEGLGDLRLGEAVPRGGRWRERGAQTGHACRTVSSPAYPGVYAIVSGGKVRRITVGRASHVKLVEGIGVGATEADVAISFPGFEAEPHKYVDAPAKYLTAPNADRGGPALRFEIGQDGKVGLLHVGTMSELAYVEGCS